MYNYSKIIGLLYRCYITSSLAVIHWYNCIHPSLVRPHVECAASVWDPYQLRNINKMRIENLLQAMGYRLLRAPEHVSPDFLIKLSSPPDFYCHLFKPSITCDIYFSPDIVIPRTTPSHSSYTAAAIHYSLMYVIGIFFQRR